jgi:hypothetical protein
MLLSLHTIEKIKKKGFDKRTLVLLIILFSLVGIRWVVFDLIVPKTAAFTLPHKWRMIPLRQTRNVVQGYFGEPLPKDSSVTADEWSNGSKGKMYFLKIYYVSDTIAASYSIHYRFTHWAASRNYLVDTGSIR